jgi:hypothetical protein
VQELLLDAECLYGHIPSEEPTSRNGSTISRIVSRGYFWMDRCRRSRRPGSRGHRDRDWQRAQCRPVLSYGADRIVDYTATPLLQAIGGQRFDVVLNLLRTSPEETAQLADLAAGRH